MIPISIDNLLSGTVVESNRIEFKKDWNPERVLHTICAFANNIDNIGGGYIIIALTGMIKTSDYLTGLQFAFNGYYITYSIIKTAVFSFIISSISAYYGYWAKGGSLGVGRSATKAIVVASALILIFNLILTRIML